MFYYIFWVLFAVVLLITGRVVYNVVNERFFGFADKVFFSTLVIACGGFVLFLLVTFFPTETSSSIIPPSEYDYAKSEQKVVYVHEDNHHVSTDAYFHAYAGDSSKVKVVQGEFINIDGEVVGTVIFVNKK